MTPPESPVGIGFKVKIERGGCRISVPISVPHVSAVAAANAPANATAKRGESRASAATAQAAAMPPLAKTCAASRGPSLPMSTSSRLRALPRRESAIELAKNASRTAAPRMPSAPKVAAPTATAASAPAAVERVDARRAQCHDARETRADQKRDDGHGGVSRSGEERCLPGGHTSRMEIQRNGATASQVGPAATFTGAVRIDSPFKALAPGRTGGAIVTFEPGARTAWHTHPLGQTLIVTAGLGWTQCEGGPRRRDPAGRYRLVSARRAALARARRRRRP